MRFLDRFLGPRRSVETDIAQLEQEFKGIAPIILSPGKHIETPEEAKLAVAKLTSRGIVISRVPSVAKGRGEDITGSLVFKSKSGSPIVVGLGQTQEDQRAEIEPGGPLRLSIPEKNPRIPFISPGTEVVVYARGNDSHKWVFNTSVPGWGVQ